MYATADTPATGRALFRSVDGGHTWVLRRRLRYDVPFVAPLWVSPVDPEMVFFGEWSVDGGTTISPAPASGFDWRDGGALTRSVLGSRSYSIDAVHWFPLPDASPQIDLLAEPRSIVVDRANPRNALTFIRANLEDRYEVTTDGGSSWTVMTQAIDEPVFDPVVRGRVWALRTGDWKLIHSDDGGVTWLPTAVPDPQPQPPYYQRLRVVRDGMGSAILAFDEFALRYVASRDGGATFQALTLPSGAGLGGLIEDPTRPGRLLAASSSGLVESLDAARSWHSLDARGLARVELEAIAGGPVALYGLLGNGDSVFRSSDRGASWSLIASGLDSSLLATDPNDDRIVVVNTPQGDLRYSTNAGSTWKAISRLAIGPDCGSFYRVAVSGRTLYLFASTYLCRSLDAGDTWTRRAVPDVPATDNLSVDPLDARHLTEPLRDGTLVESRDGGDTWTTGQQPQTPRAAPPTGVLAETLGFDLDASARIAPYGTGTRSRYVPRDAGVRYLTSNTILSGGSERYFTQAPTGAMAIDLAEPVSPAEPTLRLADAANGLPAYAFCDAPIGGVPSIGQRVRVLRDGIDVTNSLGYAEAPPGIYACELTAYGPFGSATTTRSDTVRWHLPDQTETPTTDSESAIDGAAREHGVAVLGVLKPGTLARCSGPSGFAAGSSAISWTVRKRDYVWRSRARKLRIRQTMAGGRVRCEIQRTTTAKSTTRSAWRHIHN